MTRSMDDVKKSLPKERRDKIIEDSKALRDEYFTVDQTPVPDPRDKQIEDLQDLVYFYKQIIRKLTKDD